MLIRTMTGTGKVNMGDIYYLARNERHLQLDDCYLLHRSRDFVERCRMAGATYAMDRFCDELELLDAEVFDYKYPQYRPVLTDEIRELWLTEAERDRMLRGCTTDPARRVIEGLDIVYWYLHRSYGDLDHFVNVCDRLTMYHDRYTGRAGFELTASDMAIG